MENWRSLRIRLPRPCGALGWEGELRRSFPATLDGGYAGMLGILKAGGGLCAA